MQNQGGNSRLLSDYVRAILFAVAIALFIRFFFLEAFRIPTDVMKPTLESGDLIFGFKAAYAVKIPGAEKHLWKRASPKYGEVVTYTREDFPESHFIKRIVGLPGDTVQIQNGNLILNGFTLPFEEEAKPDGATICGREKHPKVTYHICKDKQALANSKVVKVPKGHVYVIGDFRKRRISKNIHGIVPVERVTAKAMWVWLSIDPKRKGWTPAFRLKRMFRRVE